MSFYQLKQQVEEHRDFQGEVLSKICHQSSNNRRTCLRTPATQKHLVQVMRELPNDQQVQMSHHQEDAVAGETAEEGMLHVFDAPVTVGAAPALPSSSP